MNVVWKNEEGMMGAVGGEPTEFRVLLHRLQPAPLRLAAPTLSWKSRSPRISLSPYLRQ